MTTRNQTRSVELLSTDIKHDGRVPRASRKIINSERQKTLVAEHKHVNVITCSRDINSIKEKNTCSKGREIKTDLIEFLCSTVE